MMAATTPRAWLRLIARHASLRYFSAIPRINYSTVGGPGSSDYHGSDNHHNKPHPVEKIGNSHIHKDVRLPKKFYVNGTLRPDYTQGAFFVEPDNSKLINSINEHEYILITGHRGSGKSTRCLYSIKHDLKDHRVIWTSLQPISAATTPGAFWEAFGKIIKSQCKHSSIGWAPDNKDITCQSTFVEFFEYHQGKQIVLFIDEFDFLLALPEALAELTDALRWMREQQNVYGLQSVVAIGPYNITRFPKKQLSPFNSTHHWDIPYFTKEQVIRLFEDFEFSCSVELEHEIVDRIYDITMGHPGMVCWCGKAIQERLLSKNALTLDKWMEYEIFKLPSAIITGWQTVDKLATAVAEPKYSAFLIDNILSQQQGMAYNSRDPIQLELIGIGALTLRDGMIEVSSPLVRTIILKNVVYQDTYNFKVLPINGGLLDVPALVRNIHQFDPVHMKNAPLNSFKQNTTSSADAKEYQPVPQEDVYKVEIFQLLKAALPPKYTVDTECNSSARRNADIVVTNPYGDRVVVELVAHTRDGNEGKPEDTSVLGHIERCALHYAKIPNVHQLWVVNFTTKKPKEDMKNSGYGYVWSRHANVQVIHIWHNLKWTEAIITEKTDAGDYTTTPLHLSKDTSI